MPNLIRLSPSGPFSLYAAQTEWYVDIVNGNNGNSGQLGHPIADLEELGRRIFPNGSRLMLTAATSRVTIYIAAGTYLQAYFAAGSADEGSAQANPYTLRIICAKGVSLPITLSAAVNPVAPTTRGQLTTPSGSFTYKKRIRIISGSSAGSVAYSTGLNSGPQNTYLSGLVIPDPESFHIFSGANSGDVVQEETPSVLIRRAEFNCGPQTRIIIENAQIIRVTINGDCAATPSGDAGGNVTFSACDAAGGFSIWQCNAGGANMFGCRITNATVFQGFGWLFWGCVNQGLTGIANGSISSYGFTIDSGILITNVMANFEFKSTQGASRFTAEQSYNGAGTIEVQNGGNAYGIGACINVLTGGEFINAGRGATQGEIWGTSSPYAVGFYCAPGGYLYQDGVNSTGDQLLDYWKIPSTVNLRIGTTDYAYSKNERPDPNHNCGLLAARYI